MELMEPEPGSHVRTIIQEGGGRFSVICSCGWSAGASYESEMGAGMAYAMLHQWEPEDGGDDTVSKENES